MAEMTHIAGLSLGPSLGVGALTEVFAAHTPEGRPAVLKRMHRHIAADRALVGLLEHEARVLRALDHPGVPAVYGEGAHAGCPALLLRLQPGDGLDKRPAGPMPVRRAVAIVTGLLAVLGYVHGAVAGSERLAIVHRDVSPQNVLVTPEGQVSLVDFGIATSCWRDDPDRGRLKGTRGYLAPEVITGEAPVEAPSDLFAVGVLLYELVSGARAFGGSMSASMLATVEGPRPAVPHPGLNAVLARALARDPRARFQHADAMAQALDDALAREAAP